MNTISTIQRLFGSGAAGMADPRKNLLMSLKPFLRQSRQDKLSEYLTILSITSALGIFGNKGSD
ncbi:hypothetical protein D3C73_1519800 [compost metagenome]